MRARFPRVLYAVKAFTSHAVLRIAVEEGLDLLVASGGELEAALRAGVPGPRIADARQQQVRRRAGGGRGGRAWRSSSSTTPASSTGWTRPPARRASCRTS